jgi:molecular chaperone GrpE
MEGMEPEEKPVQETVTEPAKKRKSSKTEEIATLQDEIRQLKEQLLRKAAEFDNYKKRTERELLMYIRNASEELITKLLPVLDDMDRLHAHITEEPDIHALREGSELIYKKFTDTLEKEGLKPLPSLGEHFDPEKHDALLQVEKAESEGGTIVEEHLKGYTLNDKVIRHAQVIVAK